MPLSAQRNIRTPARQRGPWRGLNLRDSSADVGPRGFVVADNIHLGNGDIESRPGLKSPSYASAQPSLSSTGGLRCIWGVFTIIETHRTLLAVASSANAVEIYTLDTDAVEPYSMAGAVRLQDAGAVDVPALVSGGSPVQFIYANKLVYIITGGTTIWKTDGITAYRVGILPPISTYGRILYAAGLLSGIYQWRTTFYNDDLGTESLAFGWTGTYEGTPPAGTFTDDSMLAVSVLRGKVTVLAREPVLGIDAQVTHVRLYRRKVAEFAAGPDAIGVSYAFGAGQPFPNQDQAEDHLNNGPLDGQFDWRAAWHDDDPSPDGTTSAAGPYVGFIGVAAGTSFGTGAEQALTLRHGRGSLLVELPQAADQQIVSAVANLKLYRRKIIQLYTPPAALAVFMGNSADPTLNTGEPDVPAGNPWGRFRYGVAWWNEATQIESTLREVEKTVITGWLQANESPLVDAFSQQIRLVMPTPPGTTSHIRVYRQRILDRPIGPMTRYVSQVGGVGLAGTYEWRVAIKVDARESAAGDYRGGMLVSGVTVTDLFDGPLSIIAADGVNLRVAFQNGLYISDPEVFPAGSEYQIYRRKLADYDGTDFIPIAGAQFRLVKTVAIGDFAAETATMAIQAGGNGEAGQVLWFSLLDDTADADVAEDAPVAPEAIEDETDAGFRLIEEVAIGMLVDQIGVLDDVFANPKKMYTDDALDTELGSEGPWTVAQSQTGQQAWRLAKTEAFTSLDILTLPGDTSGKQYYHIIDDVPDEQLGSEIAIDQQGSLSAPLEGTFRLSGAPVALPAPTTIQSIDFYAVDDNGHDDDVDPNAFAPERNTVPPENVVQAAFHNGRMHYSVEDQMYFSDLESPDYVPGESYIDWQGKQRLNDAPNIIRIGHDGGDITALAIMYGQLIIGKRRNLHRMVGALTSHTNATWALRETNQAVLVEPPTAQIIEADPNTGVIGREGTSGGRNSNYLGFEGRFIFCNHEGVWLYAGGVSSQQISEPIQSLWDGLSPYQKIEATIGYDRRLRVVLIVVPEDAATPTAGIVLVFHPTTGAWTQWATAAEYSAAGLPIATVTQSDWISDGQERKDQPVFGGADGMIHYLSGSLDQFRTPDGQFVQAAVVWMATMGQYDGGVPDRDKRIDYLGLRFAMASGSSLAFGYEVPGETPVLDSESDQSVTQRRLRIGRRVPEIAAVFNGVAAGESSTRVRFYEFDGTPLGFR